MAEGKTVQWKVMIVCTTKLSPPLTFSVVRVQKYLEQEYPSQEYREQEETGPEHHDPIYETIDSYPDFPQPKQIPSPGPDFHYPQKSYKNQDIPIFEVPHHSH